MPRVDLATVDGIDVWESNGVIRYSCASCGAEERMGRVDHTRCCKTSPREVTIVSTAVKAVCSGQAEGDA